MKKKKALLQSNTRVDSSTLFDDVAQKAVELKMKNGVEVAQSRAERELDKLHRKMRHPGRK